MPNIINMIFYMFMYKLIRFILKTIFALFKGLFNIGGLLKPRSRGTLQGRPLVVDGDGLVFPGDVRVRLHGLDAPEMGQPTGKASKDRLSELVNEGPVTVKIKGRDKYGRNVGIVYNQHGEDLNARMVAEGYARAYGSFAKDYLALERRAKRDGLGLWPTGDMDIHPEHWRKAQR